MSVVRPAAACRSISTDSSRLSDPSSRPGRMWLWMSIMGRPVPLQLHTLEFAIQGLAFDAQDLRGLALVAAGGGQHLADFVLLDIRQGIHGFVARFHGGERFEDGFAVDAAGQDGEAFDDETVFEA